MRAREGRSRAFARASSCETLHESGPVERAHARVDRAARRAVVTSTTTTAMTGAAARATTDASAPRATRRCARANARGRTRRTRARASGEAKFRVRCVGLNRANECANE